MYAGDNNVGSNTCIPNWRKESQIIIPAITEKRLFDQFVLLHFADILKYKFSENSQNLTTWCNFAKNENFANFTTTGLNTGLTGKIDRWRKYRNSLPIYKRETSSAKMYQNTAWLLEQSAPLEQS